MTILFLLNLFIFQSALNKIIKVRSELYNFFISVASAAPSPADP